MSILDRLRDVLGMQPRLRNKPGGMAFIVRIPANTAGADQLNNRVVKTLRTNERGLWEIEPYQAFIATANTHFPGTNSTYLKGEVVMVCAIADECLEPWKEDEDGVTDEEVRDLYAPDRRVMRPAKEPSHA